MWREPPIISRIFTHIIGFILFFLLCCCSAMLNKYSKPKIAHMVKSEDVFALYHDTRTHGSPHACSFTFATTSLAK